MFRMIMSVYGDIMRSYLPSSKSLNHWQTYGEIVVTVIVVVEPLEGVVTWRICLGDTLPPKSATSQQIRWVLFLAVSHDYTPPLRGIPGVLNLPNLANPWSTNILCHVHDHSTKHHLRAQVTKNLLNPHSHPDQPMINKAPSAAFMI